MSAGKDSLCGYYLLDGLLKPLNTRKAPNSQLFTKNENLEVTMGFYYAKEKKNFELQWKSLRKQYEAAGMSQEAIQAMYEYDRSVFNGERAYLNHAQDIAMPSFDNTAESYSPLLKKYQDSISVTESHHETKSRFSWIGKIENEELLSALENLSDADLKLLTLYVYEGYTVTEISKVLGVSQPTISIKIKRITNFLKKFDFNAMD